MDGTPKCQINLKNRKARLTRYQKDHTNGQD